MDTKAPRKAYTRRASRVSTVEGKTVPVETSAVQVLKRLPKGAKVDAATRAAEASRDGARLTMVERERDHFIGRHQSECLTNQTLRNDMATLRGKLAAAETSIANLSKNLALKNEVIADLVKQRDHAINETSKVCQQRDDARRYLSSAQDAAAHALLERDEARTENAKLEKAFNEINEAHQRVMEQREAAEFDRDALNSEREAMSIELADAKFDIANYRKEIAAYQGIETERDEARERLAETKKGWANDVSLMGEWQKIIDGLRKSLSEVLNDLAEAKEAIAKDRAEIARLHEVRIDEQAAHQRTQEVASLRQQLAQADEHFSSMLTCRNALLDQRNDLITERDTYRKVIDLLCITAKG